METCVGPRKDCYVLINGKNRKPRYLQYQQAKCSHLSDWDTLDRLNEKGHISGPKCKTKYVTLSDEAVELSEKLFMSFLGYLASKSGIQ